MDGVNIKGMRRLSAIVLACFIGAPLAAAPLAFKSPDFRPLTIGRTIHVAQAFGPDDEDCVFETYHASRPGHQIHAVKKLICEE